MSPNYAVCEWFDQTCGELSDYLDKNDLSKNTLILYVCDNDLAANEHQ